MATANYINQLLYRYDCVILPGFGAFITQRESAQIDAVTNEFHPPQKKVSFNSQLVKNDGLLANYIMEAEKISYDEAVEKINEFVEDLNGLLGKNKSVQLAEVGSFSMSEEEKLQFEPVAGKNYLKEAFGLSSYSSNQIKEENSPKQGVSEEKEPVVLSRETKPGRPYLKYAAVGLLALGLSGFTGFNIYTQHIEEHNIAAQQQAESKLGSQIQQATFIIDNPLPAITLNVAKQSGKYHIVAGAFRMEENAEKKVEELKKEGFKARQIGVNRYGLHQVVYSSYENRLEALKVLRKVKRSSNSGAWLLVQEL